jgi:MFS transporter, DHA1 family, tetracycline resistance protein
MNERTSTQPPRATLLFVLASAFLSAMGFGLVGPLLPFLVARFVGDPKQLAAVVGWLGVSYALCAFFASPALGALSDRYGRRPVLLVSLLGSAVGYAIFGFGGALWVLFLGRILDGLTAGNFSAIFGYLADSTSNEERGKYFGYIGASIGAGFILGPALGGVASKFSLEAPFFIAAGLTLLNLLWGYFLVPESLKPERRSSALHLVQLNPFTQIVGLFKMAAIRPLLITGVLFMVPFAMSQTTLTLLLKDSLGWGADQVSFVYIVVGISDIIVQGLLLGWLIKLLKDRGVALLGLLLSASGFCGFALLPIFPSSLLVFASILAFGIGEGIFTASLGSLISQAAGDDAQGRVQGGNQATQSLAQVVGPLIGGPLYSRVSSSAPFFTGTGLVLLGAIMLGVGTQSKQVTKPLEV